MDKRKLSQRYFDRVTAYLLGREARSREIDEIDMYALARRLASLAFEGKSTYGDLFAIAYDQHYGPHYDELKQRRELEFMQSEWTTRRENDAVEQAEAIRRRTEAERSLRTLPKSGTTGEGDVRGLREENAGNRAKKPGKVLEFRRK